MRSIALLICAAALAALPTATAAASPGIDEIAALPAAVDVTTAPAQVTIRAHLFDPAGVDSARVMLASDQSMGDVAQGPMTLVMGTAEDGYWEATVTVPPTWAPGAASATVWAKTGGVETGGSGLSVLDVTSDADVTAPTILSVAMNKKAADVGGGPVDVVITAHVTDDRQVASGVWSLVGPAGMSGAMTLVDGDQQDGVWQATVTVPADVKLGSYDLSVVFYDADPNAGFTTGPALKVSRTVPAPVIPTPVDPGPAPVEERAPALPAPVVSTPARDVTAPITTLTVATKQERARVLRSGLPMAVTCSEACRVRGELLLGKTVLARGEKRLAAAGKAQLRLKLSAKARRRVRRGRKVVATLRTTAVDAAGNARVTTRRITLR